MILRWTYRVGLGCVLAACVAAVAARAESGKTNAAPRYTLSQCVDVALERNADVLVAKKRLEETSGAIVEARAGYLPSLTTAAAYELLESDYAQLSGTLSNRQDYIWNVELRLTQTVYSGGAVQGRMSIARLWRDARMLEYQAIVNRVVMDVRIAFYELLRNRSAVNVHQQAIRFLEEQLNNERARLELGSGQRLHVLRAEVGLALERAALVEATNRLRNSYLQLSELLAIPYAIEQDDVPFDVDGKLGYEKTGLQLTDCLQQALTQRPELEARDKEIGIQKKQLIVDRSAVLPRVELFAGYDVVSEPDRARPVDFYDGYVAGVAVRWHLFDGMATRGRMNATRARIDAVELSRDATERAVQVEVVRAFHDLRRAEETIQTQRANVELATESLKLSTANFELGLISQLELLQSRLDLSRAQTAELSARFDYNAALARLERAMGGNFTIREGE